MRASSPSGASFNLAVALHERRDGGAEGLHEAGGGLVARYLGYCGRHELGDSRLGHGRLEALLDQRRETDGAARYLRRPAPVKAVIGPAR